MADSPRYITRLSAFPSNFVSIVSETALARTMFTIRQSGCYSVDTHGHIEASAIVVYKVIVDAEV